MGTQQATAPDEVLYGQPRPPLRHYFCRCQAGLPKPFSRCGVALDGKPHSATGFKPMELCGMCNMMRDEHTPCQFCGVPAA